MALLDVAPVLLAEGGGEVGMTKHEAIEVLEEVKMLDDSMFAYSQAYNDALDMAIEALKAQEPEKEKIPEYPCKNCCSPSERAACCGCEKERQWQNKYGEAGRAVNLMTKREKVIKGLEHELQNRGKCGHYCHDGIETVSCEYDKDGLCIQHWGNNALALLKE